MHRLSREANDVPSTARSLVLWLYLYVRACFLLRLHAGLKRRSSNDAAIHATQSNRPTPSLCSALDLTHAPAEGRTRLIHSSV